MAGKNAQVLGVLGLLMPFQAVSQTANDMTVLMGLAPVTVLSKTSEGNAALAANFIVTGGTTQARVVATAPARMRQQAQETGLESRNVGSSIPPSAQRLIVWIAGRERRAARLFSGVEVHHLDAGAIGS